MFSSLGLFQTLPCPDVNCRRFGCIFSHRTDLPSPRIPRIPVDVVPVAPIPHRPTHRPVPSCTSATTPQKVANILSPTQAMGATSVLTKRATPTTPTGFGVNKECGTGEPPRKLQKIGVATKPLAIPSATHTSTGVPLLRVNAAQSRVAVPVRQAMVKNLYDHFVVLYELILPSNPTLASEHALRQEDEVYKNSNKLAYRNAVISSIASLKKRPKPDVASHPSVGTEGDLHARAESRKSLDSLRLTRRHLEPLVMSMADMRKFGYVVDSPDGPGGDKPSQEGALANCERCSQPFQVSRMKRADECLYHWGRPYNKTVNGEKMRVYNCCSRSTSHGEGCVRGPHVFSESKPEQLHSRHPFSPTRSASADEDAIDTALDVVALDCEMIYTTAGMSVARVSVVDGSGRPVFDQFVRLDDGVEIIDYNTRFSGVSTENHGSAVLTLTSIRTSLDALINSDTILIGHALDNDLKTLRIVHHRCVDSAHLFPHNAGPPYKRSLRELVREHLGTIIQTGGGTVGHSSVEDSVATLDLVRWYVLNGPKRRTSIPVVASSRNAKCRAIDI